jgi:hypothetical protein
MGLIMEITSAYRINFKGFFKRNKFTGTVNCVSWLVMFFFTANGGLCFFCPEPGKNQGPGKSATGAF